MKATASLLTFALIAVLPLSPALAAPHTSAEVDLFAQALRGMKLVKKAKKNYEPGRGDPCFAALRDLDLEHGHKLVRRTGILEPPKAGEERVRIDRIYRLTNHGHDDQDNTPRDTPPNLKDLDDSGGEGGEIVWATAMYADQVSVKLAEGKTAKDWNLAAYPIIRQVTDRVLLVRLTPKQGDDWPLESALQELDAMPKLVEFAEPNFLIRSFVDNSSTAPTDPDYTVSTKRWHLDKTNALGGWPIVTGDAANANNAVIAVLDTGFDNTHPDLSSNVWRNPGEFGHDEEGDGLINDLWGWDFIRWLNDPFDTHGHGTHVAGIAGAIANNGHGSVGGGWQVKLMSMRIINMSSTGTIIAGGSDTAQSAFSAIIKLNAANRQVAAINCSWGMTSFSGGLFDTVNNNGGGTAFYPYGGTIAANSNLITMDAGVNMASIVEGEVITANLSGIAAGALVMYKSGTTVAMVQPSTITSGTKHLMLTFTRSKVPVSYKALAVCAAGDAVTTGVNTDLTPIFPACFPTRFVVSVAGSDQSDNPVANSNYGPNTVDLHAPGTAIWSTWWKLATSGGPTGYVADGTSTTQGYVAQSGTSTAAPQVSAAIALYALLNPTATETQIKNTLLSTAALDVVSSLSGKSVTAGRLNLGKFFATPPVP